MAWRATPQDSAGPEAAPHGPGPAIYPQWLISEPTSTGRLTPFPHLSLPAKAGARLLNLAVAV